MTSIKTGQRLWPAPWLDDPESALTEEDKDAIVDAYAFLCRVTIWHATEHLRDIKAHTMIHKAHVKKDS